MYIQYTSIKGLVSDVKFVQLWMGTFCLLQLQTRRHSSQHNGGNCFRVPYPCNKKCLDAILSISVFHFECRTISVRLSGRFWQRVWALISPVFTLLSVLWRHSMLDLCGNLSSSQITLEDYVEFCECWLCSRQSCQLLVASTCTCNFSDGRADARMRTEIAWAAAVSHQHWFLSTKSW